MKTQILNHLPSNFPWRDSITWYESIDSTNTRAKELADSGAPHGSVFIANEQTAGRGRKGRSFASAAGMGIYLSVILRPNCAGTDLMHLTCATSVEMCQAVEEATGVRPGIKWTNDLVYGKQKLGGILTELSLNSQTGLVDYAIVGIGINCLQQVQDFPMELQEIATSLSIISNKEIDRSQLCAAIMTSLARMSTELLSNKSHIMAAYRRSCITLGQEISLFRADTVQHGTALDIDEDGGLLVLFADGSTQTVTSGEVSVRGMYGYL